MKSTATWDKRSEDIERIYGKKPLRKGIHGTDFYATQKHWYEVRASKLAEQDGKCAICNRDIELKPAKWPNAAHLDHNHVTGQIRDVLCAKCNTGLGCFGDNTSKMLKAIHYLKKWQDAAKKQKVLTTSYNV